MLFVLSIDEGKVPLLYDQKERILGGGLIDHIQTVQYIILHLAWDRYALCVKLVIASNHRICQAEKCNQTAKFLAFETIKALLICSLQLLQMRSLCKQVLSQCKLIWIANTYSAGWDSRHVTSLQRHSARLEMYHSRWGLEKPVQGALTGFIWSR